MKEILQTLKYAGVRALCAGVLAVCAMMMVSCGSAKLSPEEKAARREADAKHIVNALIQRHYRINVNSMLPLRGEMIYLSGKWIVVDSTSVDCSLPYLGRDDIPHFKTRGEMRMDSQLEFRADTEDYVVELDPSGQSTVVSFRTSFRGSDYQFIIRVDDVNQAHIHVIPEDRDEITYEGDVYASEKVRE